MTPFHLHVPAEAAWNSGTVCQESQRVVSPWIF